MVNFDYVIIRNTRNKSEHDAKNRLSLPGPSPEKLMAEIIRLKKTDPRPLFRNEYLEYDNNKLFLKTWKVSKAAQRKRFVIEPSE